MTAIDSTTGKDIREARFLDLLWPQIGDINDLNFGKSHGTHYNVGNPLTLDKRFIEITKKKKS